MLKKSNSLIYISISIIWYEHTGTSVKANTEDNLHTFNQKATSANSDLVITKDMQT